jgi:hypothetical protein
MFVKLTRNFDGRAVYVNPNMVSGVTPHSDHTCVWCCDTEREPFEVKESPETVVTLLEAAMKGGLLK